MWSNTDEFKAVALEFKDRGAYCSYPTGSRSHKVFWDEQKKRSLEGYHIGRDWISGYHYWYLNFCPIKQVIPVLDKTGKPIFNKDGTTQGEEIVDNPLFWDSDAEYFWYLDEAEKQ